MIILFSRAHRRHEPLIADERVHDEHTDDKEKETDENTLAAPLGALGGLAFGRFAGCHCECS